MSRKRFTPEQIISKLREVEIELAKGQKAAEACRKIGVTEETYYRWRKEYGGLRVDQAKRLKDLEKDDLPPVVVPTAKLVPVPLPPGGAERSLAAMAVSPPARGV